MKARDGIEAHQQPTADTGMGGAGMSDTGIVKSISLTADDDNRQVLRAIIDFYDGNAPDLTWSVVFDRIPVRIIKEMTDEARAESFSRLRASQAPQIGTE